MPSRKYLIKNQKPPPLGVGSVTPVKDEESDLSGYEISVEYSDIESFASENFSFYSTHKDKCAGIQQRKGFFFDAYNFDFIAALDPNLSPEEAENVKSALVNGSVSVTIKLPYSPDSNNADMRENGGKDLTWGLDLDLAEGKERSVQVSFKLWHFDKILLPYWLI